MFVRAYQTSDLHSITELMSDLGYPTTPEIMRTRLERIESDSLYHTFVAEEQGEVAGMIGFRLLYSYEVDEVVTQISALVTMVLERFRPKSSSTMRTGYINFFNIISWEMR